jgi:hypothetical protein
MQQNPVRRKGRLSCAFEAWLTKALDKMFDQGRAEVVIARLPTKILIGTLIPGQSARRRRAYACQGQRTMVSEMPGRLSLGAPQLETRGVPAEMMVKVGRADERLEFFPVYGCQD